MKYAFRRRRVFLRPANNAKWQINLIVRAGGARTPVWYEWILLRPKLSQILFTLSSLCRPLSVEVVLRVFFFCSSVCISQCMKEERTDRLVSITIIKRAIERERDALFACSGRMVHSKKGSSACYNTMGLSFSCSFGGRKFNKAPTARLCIPPSRRPQAYAANQNSDWMRLPSALSAGNAAALYSCRIFSISSHQLFCPWETSNDFFLSKRADCCFNFCLHK